MASDEERTVDVDIEESVGQIAGDLFGVQPEEPKAEESQEEEVAVTEEEVVEETPEVTAESEETTEEEEEPEPVVSSDAPHTWPKKMREHWKNVPAEVQEYMHTREQQMMEGLNQYKDRADFGEQIEKIATPYKPMMNAYGLADVGDALGKLLNAQYRLTTGTTEERQRVYQELGKDLGLIAADPNQPAPDPQIQNLTTQVQGLHAQLQEQNRAAEYAKMQEIQTEVDKFFDDPAHPYADQLESEIAALVKTGKTLQEAYDMAVWANPETREAELLRISQETAKQGEESRQKAVRKAKQAKKVNVRPKEVQHTSSEPLGSMEETLQSTLNDIRTRT